MLNCGTDNQPPVKNESRSEPEDTEQATYHPVLDRILALLQNRTPLSVEVER
jgi:hypothetical protein